MSGSPAARIADPGRAPLSSAQRLWWAQDTMAAFGPRFVVVRSLRLNGPVNTAALQAALDDVVARHEILRTVVMRNAEPPYQQIHPPSPVPLHIHSLPGVPAEAREACAQELLIEAEQSSVKVEDLPLLRADLHKFDDHDSVLTLVGHHTACDAWSMSLIISDLAACYTARAAGQEPALPPVRQYREFTAREAAIADSPMAQEARAYWRQKLQGAQFFALPADRPIPQPPSSPYHAHHFTIDADVMNAVSAIAKRAHTTVFTVLVAAIDVLAYHINGTTDPVLRNITSGRNERQFHDTVGVTLNFVPLRTDTSQCGSFREIVDSVRDTTIEASSQEISLDIIAEEAPELYRAVEDPRLDIFLLGYNREPASSPDVKIADGAQPVVMPGVEGHVGPQLPGGFVWNMHLLRSGELKCRTEYNSVAFDADTVAGFADEYRRILTRAAAEPDRKWQTL